ncbi:MAG: tRNA (adenosine(37)-N6)-threonylcarbamoyltransferase complex transferase subunit TsaD [Patescibacteria group bacterium]
MKILSIETSCDDTAISIMETRLAKSKQAKGGMTNASFKVLANNVSSQIALHIPYGGVFPVLAKREHLKNLPILLEKTLKDAGIFRERTLAQRDGASRAKIQQNFMRGESAENPGIDLIAVTSGPGLEIALWTGIVFAKELAKKWNVPLIPVNHMEGHIFSVFVKNKKKFTISKIKNPTLALLVSGGHTELVLVKKWMNYEIIGETMDDAVGEAFDKVARMLGLPYPGGPEISKLAEEERRRLIPLLRGDSLARRGGKFIHLPLKGTPQEENNSISLPRPMLHSKNFDFSFSGLKTAVLYLIKDLGGLEKINEETKSKIALEFENAAVECLVYKTAKAIKKYKIRTLIVAGGVSANQHLKKEMQKLARNTKTNLLFPTRELSTDNSIMIGIAGYLNHIKNKKKVPKLDSIKATGNLRL